MPNAGQAGFLKKKNLDEKSRRTKKAVSTRSSSALTIATKKSANVKTQAKTVTKPRGKENTEPNKPRLKANPAPDFSKLHNKWNSQFQKGKAVAKKSNTKVKAFVLTDSNNQKSNIQPQDNRGDDDKDLHIEDYFEIDNNALQGILSNTGIEVQETHEPKTRATIATSHQSTQNTITGFSTKRTSIYYMGSKGNTISKPDAPRQLLSNPVASSNGMFMKENIDNHVEPHTHETTIMQRNLDNKNTLTDKGNDDDDDEISFKPDAMALASILNNQGIDNRPSCTSSSRHTLASTRTMPAFGALKRHSVFEEQQSKRSSIYYNGAKSTKTLTDTSRPSLIGQPYSRPTCNASSSRPTQPATQYTLGSTVVEIQGDAVIKGDDDDDEISFKPDAMALASILNNQGIENRPSCTSSSRHTLASTRTMPAFGALKRHSVFEEQPSKRTSIYYTGAILSKVANNCPKPALSATCSTLGNLGNKQTVPTYTPSNPTQYTLGSTVVGYQDCETQDNKANDVNTFVKPLTPARQTSVCKDQPRPPQEAKPCFNVALMTPSRGILDSTCQTPSSCKKQVSWADVLTPHRQQDNVCNKGSILKKCDYKRDAAIDVSSPIPTSTIAGRLFTADETTKEISREKSELEELERQALEDLKLLEIEEKHDTKPSSRLGTPSIDISGCVPLISPPVLPRTPVTPRSSDGTIRLQWIAATPQNHMRVTVRQKTPSQSPYVDFKEPSRPSRFTTPTPVRRASTVNGSDAAFGLLSSIKKSASTRPYPISFHKSLLLGEAICSSTPAVNVESFTATPLLGDPCTISRSSDRDFVTNGNHAKCGAFTSYRGNANATNNVIRDPCYGSDLRSKNGNNRLLDNQKDNPMNMTSTAQRNASLTHARTIAALQPVHALKGVYLPRTTLTEQALLDTEITLYSSLGARNKLHCYRDLTNPLTTLFSKGDSQHLVPICLCNETLRCPAHPTTHT